MPPPVRDSMADWFEDFMKNPEFRARRGLFLRIIQLFILFWISLGLVLFLFFYLKGGSV
jgi:hypothetical protein